MQIQSEPFCKKPRLSANANAHAGVDADLATLTVDDARHQIAPAAANALQPREPESVAAARPRKIRDAKSETVAGIVSQFLLPVLADITVAYACDADLSRAVDILEHYAARVPDDRAVVKSSLGRLIDQLRSCEEGADFEQIPQRLAIRGCSTMTDVLKHCLSHVKLDPPSQEDRATIIELEALLIRVRDGHGAVRPATDGKPGDSASAFVSDMRAAVAQPMGEERHSAVRDVARRWRHLSLSTRPVDLFDIGSGARQSLLFDEPATTSFELAVERELILVLLEMTAAWSGPLRA